MSEEGTPKPRRAKVSGYEPPTLGDASPREPSPEPEINPAGRMGTAHYAGISEEDAAKVWESETLCVSCLVGPMCCVGIKVQEPLIVVSRCLAYLPRSG